jgi:hypothetical protein
VRGKLVDGRTGVCLVRVEAQASHLLYTVVLNPDIATTAGERSRSFAYSEQVMQEVRQFLLAFEASHGE